MFTREKMPSLTLFLICLLTFYGCATFNPRPIAEVPFKERAQTQVKNNIRVTAAVFSAEESEAVFGVPLYKKGIQPVWLEIENKDEERVWFAPVGTDPDYFAPLEIAYIHRLSFNKKANQQMERLFHDKAMRGRIDPGSVRSGFVFTNLDMGTKAFNVDLVGEDNQVRIFTFLIPVPGLKVDYREVDFDNLYTQKEIVSHDTTSEFRKALEALPCCTTNAEGTRMGDPVNVVIIGYGRDILQVLRRSGWDETAAISETESTFRFPWAFRYTPVKPLYLFGRHQDDAFRKARATINERNQLRLWLSPLVYQGKNVWIGQISRIIRRFAWEKFRIEPNVDEARSYLLQDLWYSMGLLRFGFVKGMDVVTISKPRKSFHDDDYFTDGHRMVIWVSSDPTSLSKVEYLEWEEPLLERRKILIDQ
ncbi:MAG: LssY C-terminal domain-containing protein [Deltaproteobacteria bacterium]|nr:MAG: LssY C-terminal domain-containing protein [Deltaproteobacteria bacterium]